MRQIIFVNEARVELAPKKYRESSPEYREEKSNDSREDKNIALAYGILNKIRYNTDRIRIAPKKYRDSSDPQDVKDLANKLDNPAFSSRDEVWKK